MSESDSICLYVCRCMYYMYVDVDKTIYWFLKLHEVSITFSNLERSNQLHQALLHSLFPSFIMSISQLKCKNPTTLAFTLDLDKSMYLVAQVVDMAVVFLGLWTNTKP